MEGVRGVGSAQSEGNPSRVGLQGNVLALREFGDGFIPGPRATTVEEFLDSRRGVSILLYPTRTGGILKVEPGEVVPLFQNRVKPLGLFRKRKAERGGGAYHR